jgi:hypothetical protein
MGFDLNITLNVWIDAKTGLPFVWGPNSEKLPYVPCEYEVPEKYRKYMSQRGHHFHFYIGDIEGYTTCVDTFLDTYPEWQDVLENMGWEEKYEWTEADHDDFKEALNWLSKKHVFGITWSY